MANFSLYIAIWKKASANPIKILERFQLHLNFEFNAHPSKSDLKTYFYQKEAK